MPYAIKLELRNSACVEGKSRCYTIHRMNLAGYEEYKGITFHRLKQPPKSQCLGNQLNRDHRRICSNRTLSGIEERGA